MVKTYGLTHIALAVTDPERATSAETQDVRVCHEGTEG